MHKLTVDTLPDPIPPDSFVLGNCQAIMPHLPDQSFDMILCDLPYEQSAASWDSLIPLKWLWAEYKRLLKPGGAVALTAVQPFTSVLVMSKLKWFKHEWIWDKVTARGHLVVKKRPMQQHESVLIFADGAVNYFPIMTMRRKATIGKEGRRSELVGGQSHRHAYVSNRFYPKTIIRESGVISRRERIHPTQKPVGLFAYLIQSYTRPGALVLDNAAGAGTTAKAALRTGRHFICIEKEPRFFTPACQQITNLEEQLARNPYRKSA
jgi:site-specific DNA-methyltransferase (adenine-specific)